MGSAHKWAVIACCAFAYLYVFPYQRTINNPNENVRFYMTASMAELGRYDIDVMRARFGYVNDAAVHGGHHWSVKAPGTSFLGVPGYFLYFHGSRLLGHAYDRTEALWVCRITASVLPALLFFWCLLGWLSRRTRNAVSRDTVFFSVALGSLLYAYGMMFASHTASAITSFGAFMWLHDVRQSEREPTARGALLAGLLTAGATFFEYPGLLCSVPLAVYGAVALWGRPKPMAAFITGGALPALVMMHFHFRAFGNPLRPGHLFVENDAFRAAHEQGLYGAVGPSAKALYGLLLEPGAGLFPLTPLLALGVGGLWLLARRRDTRVEAAAVGCILLLTVLGIASMNNWRGGWTIGPRYLALCVPFLAWPALVAIDALSERAPRVAASLAIGATAVAMLASGLPGAYYPHLPPEITRPLPQIFAPLIARGYAPLNAGMWLGLSGGASMAPMAACALAALGLCIASVPRSLRAHAAIGSALVAVLLVTPLWIRPVREAGVEKALIFITGRYSPPLQPK